MSDTTMNLGGNFPIITFDTLPAGMEKGNKGRAQRTKYDWAGMNIKQGIKVPGDKYLSASSSATAFANKYPLDEAAEKKLAAHMRGRILAAKNAHEANPENKETPWTEDMAKAVKPDPDFVTSISRVFRTEAVKDNKGEIIRTKGFQTSSNQKLADEYYIIRTN